MGHILPFKMLDQAAACSSPHLCAVFSTALLLRVPESVASPGSSLAFQSQNPLSRPDESICMLPGVRIDLFVP